MNRKAIVINVIIIGLLVGFVLISVTFYYLIPIGMNIIEFFNQSINDLINIIWR